MFLSLKIHEKGSFFSLENADMSSHTWGGGPTKRGGGKNVLAMLNGSWELEVLAIVMGGRKKVPPFKRGCTKSFTLSWGGGTKKF